MKDSGSFLLPLLAPRGALPLRPDELEDENESSTIAVSPDDRILSVVAWQRIRTGAGGTAEGTIAAELWFWTSELGPFPGLYVRMTEFRGALRNEVARRASAGKRVTKRLLGDFEFIPSQVVKDPVLLHEIVTDGWEGVLASVE